MTSRPLKAAAFVFLIVFSSFTILTGLAKHDAEQAQLQQNIYRAVTIQIESAVYGTAGVLALGLSLIFLLLSYQREGSEKKCPHCGEPIQRDDFVCRFCNRG